MSDDSSTVRLAMTARPAHTNLAATRCLHSVLCDSCPPFTEDKKVQGGHITLPKTKEPADGRAPESESKTCFLGTTIPTNHNAASSLFFALSTQSNQHPHRPTCAAFADGGSSHLQGSGVEGYSGHILRHYLLLSRDKNSSCSLRSHEYPMFYSGMKAQVWVTPPFYSVWTTHHFK